MRILHNNNNDDIYYICLKINKLILMGEIDDTINYSINQ